MILYTVLLYSSSFHFFGKCNRLCRCFLLTL
nr:MAG TPA: hypothetical protein [Caudoviricetes sp.]